MPNQSLLVRTLLFYSSQLPYHPGKGQLVSRLLKWFNVRIDETFDVVRGGLHWRLNPADYVQADLFWIGRKEYYDVRHLQRILKPGDVFLDIGSNFGYYSVYLASQLKKQITVHAFEPNPPTFQRLQHHITINGLQDVVHPHQMALSDRPGTAALALREGNTGGTNVVPLDESAVPIRLSTLDAFCDEQKLERLDVVKVDVEGFEERVLRGGLEALRRWQPAILMELEPPHLEAKGSSAQRVVSLFNELGYQVFATHRQTLRPLKELPVGDSAHMNVLCLSAQHRAIM